MNLSKKCLIGESYKCFCRKDARDVVEYKMLYGKNPNKTLCLECFAELAGHIDLTLLANVLDNVIFRKKLWNY